jgi:hypothetical protein
MTEEIENTRIYLRNDSLQDALSQLTQAACFLVEGSCKRRLKIVWIILQCKLCEFSSQYVCSFATKKIYMFWYEITNQPNRSMCFICQWLSYIQKCNSNRGRYWHQILRLMLLMFFTFIMGPYMPHEGKFWYFWVFAYLVNIHITIWTRLVRNVLHVARITNYHWSQPIMYEFHNIPLEKKNPSNFLLETCQLQGTGPACTAGEWLNNLI